jgi:N-acetylglucosaminyl-diphospho-decaprenol L-rhamnosyltransferase
MIVISVVSHGHFKLIKELATIANLGKDKRFKVFLLDNIGEPHFEDWCNKYDIFYTRNREKLGFGANNNLNFSLAEKILPNKFDYFIVLNPDLIVNADILYKLKKNSRDFSAPLSTINLFLDREMSISEDCIRKFPTVFTMIKSLFFRGVSTKISKSFINSPTEIDWCAACLMGFTPDHYRALSGFDEKYFMYCEDIDICYRSLKFFGKRVVYFPDLKGVHLADRRSRNIFSLHFYWHVVSALRFLYKRHLY